MITLLKGMSLVRKSNDISQLINIIDTVFLILLQTKSHREFPAR